MTNNEGIFSSKSVYSSVIQVKVADDATLPITHIGNITLNSISRPLKLNYVFHVPTLKFILISLEKLCQDNNCIVDHDKSLVCVKDHIRAVLLRTSSRDIAYPLTMTYLQPIESTVACITTFVPSMYDVIVLVIMGIAI